MGQHNSFKKDIDMLSEAYHKMYGKGEVVEEGVLGGVLGGLGGAAATGLNPLGIAAGVGAGHSIQDAGNVGEKKSDEETHDKTGGKSDYEILKRATTEDGNLKPEARDALAKLYGSEDQEWKPDSYEQKLTQDAEAEGGYQPGGAAH